jgi:quinol monooxygenase YgiN
LDFDPQKVDEFASFFRENKASIGSFPGCISLHLHRDADLEHVFYTVSIWESEEALEAYRNSDLFTRLWSFAKARFAGKPLAFSLINEQ